MSSSFYRGLSAPFLDALDSLVDASEGQWWRDVLARPDLVIAVRSEYLNVYYRGASLFRIDRRGETIVPSTHAKYLSRSQQGLVQLSPDGRFGITPDRALWLSYEGATTLTDMVKSAAGLAGPEKIGLHGLLLASPHIVDVEISFGMTETAPGSVSPLGEPETDGANLAAAAAADVLSGHPSTPQATTRQDRLDVATLEEQAGAITAVFHEAKHFSNSELRATPDRTPPIVEQMARYRQTLAHHAPAISESYRDVCSALVRIDAMRRKVRGEISEPSSDALVARIAADALLPRVDAEPRLVVFGFDRDQRDGALAKLIERLTSDHGLSVYAVGNPSSKVTTAFRSRAATAG